jgi:pantoate--beta-alanine ligase
MGALHDGHLDLVRSAKAPHKKVVVSIFVNPKQFNNLEDLKKYPRTISQDLKLLEENGVDAVFVPNVDEIYPESQKKLDALNPHRNDPILGNLDAVWEGKYRPGHFSGVVDVVRRLFQIVLPQQVYFGQKDLQQCLVIQQLIQVEFPDMSMNLVPTKRELSGLAMSSRNMRLSEDARSKAAAIYQSLQHIEKIVCSRYLEMKNFNTEDIVLAEKERLANKGIETEYLNVIQLPLMVQVNVFNDLLNNNLENKIKLGVIFSGYLDGVRLIDNVTFDLS